MEQVNNDWYRQQGKFFFYNAGIVKSGRAAIVIDPGMTKSEFDGINHFLDNEELSCPAIILTHFHWDHILGAGMFGQVHIHTHQCFQAEQDHHRIASGKAIQKWVMESGEIPLAVADFPDPTVLTAGNSTLKIENKVLSFLHTPGHTADHLSILDESCGVLWAGDILSSHEIPFVSSSLSSYIQTMEMIKTLNLEMIIPGHGDPAVERSEVNLRVAEDMHYLYALADRVQKAVQTGLSMQEAIGICADIPIRFPPDNGYAHHWNVESAYVEFGGRSGGESVGWQKEWEDL